MPKLLERSTWHSAQRTRQLVAVLERFDIEPAGRLTAADLAGLPLPEGLWKWRNAFFETFGRGGIFFSHHFPPAVGVSRLQIQHF